MAAGTAKSTIVFNALNNSELHISHNSIHQKTDSKVFAEYYSNNPTLPPPSAAPLIYDEKKQGKKEVREKSNG